MIRHLLSASLLLTVASLALAAPTSSRPATPPGVGEIAPEIAGSLVSGSDPVSLARLQGRVVVLDFWATWCGPCQAVMPVLDQLHHAHHDNGLTVLGLTSESRAVVQRHLSRQRVGYTVASDAVVTMRRYGVRGIPMLIVIDRAGKVRHVSAGVSGREIARLRQMIPQLLAETP